MSTLSTHILDISTGTPAEGVTVSLSREGETLANLVTNAQGRIATFSAAPLPAGRYCLTAETGAWFARAGRESVFTRAQIDFVIGEAAEDHFHLPFLIAPGGWSTYRGSPARVAACRAALRLPGLDVTKLVETARRPGKAQPPPGMYRCAPAAILPALSPRKDNH
jgi:5-hydroxyisourate hydrolase